METVTGTHYDLIVDGGEPAGGTAACELARKGLPVLVLEKDHLPRYKCCAGGFPLKAARLLDLDLSPAYEMEVTQGRCTYKGRSPVLMGFGKVDGWTAMRDKLDYLILKAAMKRGAQVVDRQRLREVETRSDRAFARTGGREYSGFIVVGADGANEGGPLRRVDEAAAACGGGRE